MPQEFSEVCPVPGWCRRCRGGASINGTVSAAYGEAVNVVVLLGIAPCDRANRAVGDLIMIA